MEGFLTFIYILVLLYIFFRVATRFILPWLVKRYLKRFEKRFYANNPHVQDLHKKKEGEVNIEYTDDREHEKRDDKKTGEYIDFEEIEE